MHADRPCSGLYRPASHVMHENGLLPRCMVGGQLPHFKDLHFMVSNRTTTPPSPSKQPFGDLQPLLVVKPESLSDAFVNDTSFKLITFASAL